MRHTEQNIIRKNKKFIIKKFTKNGGDFMFCKNCGTQINENQKFCPKCGSQTGMTQTDGYASNPNRQERNYNINVSPNSAAAAAKKAGGAKAVKIIAIIAAALIVVTIAVSLFSGGSSESDIVGSWEISDVEYDSFWNEYPEDNFVIYSDGTFFSDDMYGTYSIDDDTIIFDYSIAAYSFIFSVNNNELKLIPVDDTDAYIIYEKVK